MIKSSSQSVALLNHVPYASTELKIPRYPEYFDRPDDSKEYNHLNNFLSQSKTVGSQKQLIADANALTSANSKRQPNRSPRAIQIKKKKNMQIHM